MNSLSLSYDTQIEQFEPTETEKKVRCARLQRMLQSKYGVGEWGFCGYEFKLTDNSLSVRTRVPLREYDNTPWHSNPDSIAFVMAAILQYPDHIKRLN